MAETYSAGVVTAYGAAVRGGYTGTYEEFCAEQAEFAENAAAVAQAKEDVETMQGQVEQAAATFTGTTVPAAVTTVQEAGAAQVQAVQDEGTMQAAAVETAGAQQKAAVEAAGSDAVDAVEAAETAATDAVTAAQTAAVQAVQAESTTQQAAIQTKGQETIDSIPEDYTALSGEVDDLKSALSDADAVLFKSENITASKWVKGGRAVNTGYRAGGTTPLYRINSDPVSVTGNVGVVCNSGYQFVLFAWDSTNSYLGWWRNDGGTTGFVKTSLSNADRFYTEMRLADLVANGAATISILMQKTGGATEITLDDYSNAYLQSDVVAGLSDDVSTLRGKSDFLMDTKAAFAYFASNAQPVFSLEDGSITVSRNSGNFRIYTNKGLLKTFTALGTHTITNVQKLVYDLDDDQIKVVAGTQGGNYILLLSFAGNNFNGILYPYYLKQQFEDVNSRIDNATNTAAEDFALANVADRSDFKAVFFSDIHGASANMTSILSFANENASRVDAILNGGDTAARWMNDTTYSLAWYTDAITASSIDILSAIGNHDAWDGAYFTKASAVDIYNAFIAPIVAKYTGIVQPTGAAANGLCYYYKDYASKVRVVVLNAMDESTCDFWDSAQATWLTDVLDEAKTNDLAVICLEHAPYPLPISARNAKADNWSTWYPLQTDGVKLETEAMDIVANFMGSGGKFVCWLSGHLHEDNLLEATGYPGQFMVNIVTADAERRNKVGVNTTASSPYFDGFNYIGVDTANGLLKVYRKGWDMDAGMKKHDYLCYDFVNHQVIAN